MMTRLSRQDAAQRLQVSESTLDRMIRRGDVPVEKDGAEGRQRVWVLFDDDDDDDDGDHVDHSKNGHSSSSDEELTRLRTQVQSLQELADYRGELLKESEWRYHELLGHLKQAQDTAATLARALPAASPDPGQRRRWWPFGKN